MERIQENAQVRVSRWHRKSSPTSTPQAMQFAAGRSRSLARTQRRIGSGGGLVGHAHISGAAPPRRADQGGSLSGRGSPRGFILRAARVTMVVCCRRAAVRPHRTQHPATSPPPRFGSEGGRAASSRHGRCARALVGALRSREAARTQARIISVRIPSGVEEQFRPAASDRSFRPGGGGGGGGGGGAGHSIFRTAAQDQPPAQRPRRPAVPAASSAAIVGDEGRSVPVDGPAPRGLCRIRRLTVGRLRLEL